MTRQPDDEAGGHLTEETGPRLDTESILDGAAERRGRIAEALEARSRSPHQTAEAHLARRSERPLLAMLPPDALKRVD